MSENPVRLALDSERCIGSGQCEMVEEEVFVVDDDTGIATVIQPGTLPRERAVSVVENCPAGAISIVESQPS